MAGRFAASRRNAVQYKMQTARFQRSVARAISQAPEAARTAVVWKIAMDVLKAVLRASRVDTGRYRAAWMAAGEQAGLPAVGGGRGTPEGIAKGWSEGAGESGVRVGAAYVELRNAVPYALVLEHGSRPHLIRPRRAKTLSWLRVRGDEKTRVFARRVWHPGTRGYRILARAMERGRRALDKRSFKRFLGPSAK